MKVLSTQVRSNGGMVRIALDDGGIEEAWTPDLEPVKAWGENPIPANWELKDAKSGKGKVLLNRDEKRGGGGYSTSKEAFDRSAASRLAWQREEEDRKDRRTALMTAAEMLRPMQEKHGSGEVSPELGKAVADWMYEWLRSSPAVSEPAARAVATKGEASPAGDPSSAASGDTADAKPGEEGVDNRVLSTAAGQAPSPGFPIAESECSHKGASGRWLPTKAVDGQARCPRCGASAVIYMESASP